MSAEQEADYLTGVRLGLNCQDAAARAGLNHDAVHRRMWGDPGFAVRVVVAAEVAALATEPVMHSA